ncbi:MAG: hypothetical protein ABIC18_05275 [Candidatus Omnitrophota bacterium]
MKILVLLRRNILGQNNYPEAKEAFLLLLLRRIIAFINLPAPWPPIP